jgi:hypothetical protein
MIDASDSRCKGSKESGSWKIYIHFCCGYIPWYSETIRLVEAVFRLKAYLWREAEQEISRIEGLKSVMIRPGLMFSNHDRPHLTPIRGIISGLASINDKLGRVLPLGAAAIQPLDVEIVARAVIKATISPDITGIIDVNTISKLAM